MPFKESETVELKKSTSELKEGIISIAAILNKHQKGEIYFGIKKDGKVIGQQITEKTIRDVSKAVADHLEPKVFPKINQITMEGKQCIHVDFSGDDIPYFAYGRCFIRVGDEDRKINPQELGKIFEKKNETFWEKRISKKIIKDVNEETLRDYVERANTAKRINFGFTNVKSVLNKLGLLQGNKLSRAAEVLFCDENPLEVQAAVFAGTDKLTFLDIRQFKGNIFRLLHESESYIKEHINWRAELKERVRKEIPEIPIRAIIEALVNSLCHKDYTNLKGNEVAIFKDRVEIYNPGQFPEGYDPQDFFAGTERSILRNPLLANTLYLSKDIERWGSGLKRIHDVCKEENVKVDLKKIKSGFLVVFYRKAEWGVEKDTIEDTIKDTIKFTSGTERSILEEMIKNPKITSEQLSAKIDVNVRNVKKNIEKLKKKKLVKRVGSRKSGHWEIIE